MHLSPNNFASASPPSLAGFQYGPGAPQGDVREFHRAGPPAVTPEHDLAIACGRLTGSRSRSGTLDPFRGDAAANPTAAPYRISAPPSHPSRPPQLYPPPQFIAQMDYLVQGMQVLLNDNTELKRRVANLEQRVSGAENTLNQRGGRVSHAKTRTTNVAVSHQHNDAAAQFDSDYDAEYQNIDPILRPPRPNPRVEHEFSSAVDTDAGPAT
ncbi:hypothetical protein FB45DRAFT_1062578 [Roridomyces roridus]|uniref:Uncharacterized protein n=1 Tax=Roridomyces roridus TaxID=1738132 RepID=A0AAD7BG54_9AGAR|nr:hypothetical protein FB45DRAFT_1062578 [Roridomyces roridus]